MLEAPKVEYRVPRAVFTGQDETAAGGLPVRRLIGIPAIDMLDPFLRFDAFSVPEREPPPDPHSYPQRGFECVTYLLAGEIRYEDDEGHSGTVEAGGVQWLQAGRGVVRSDTLHHGSGPVAGLQFWVNLPRTHKDVPAACRDFGPTAIPVENRGGQISVHVLAGTSSRGTTGPVLPSLTDLRCFDIRLGPGAAVVEPVPGGHSAVVYMMAGTLEFPGDDLGVHPLATGTLAQLSGGTELRVSAGAGGARFLFAAGRPLREPVARSGGFVMNTLAELRTAQEAFRRGRFAG